MRRDRRWIPLFWSLPIGVGLLGLVRGYHAPQELIFEAVSIVSGLIAIAHYGFYGRISATMEGLESKDWFWYGDWWLPYTAIRRVDAKVVHGGRSVATVLVLHTDGEPFEISMAHYKHRDLYRFVDVLRERAPEAVFADDLPEYIDTA
jgi:hypothetical protein